jgi:putative ABC transport system permease protein
MSWLDGMRHRVRTVLQPAAFEAELLEEMRAHQELDAEEQGGASQTGRRFGNETWYREETRRMTWLGTLDTWRQDASHAWRSITRTPGVTAVIVVTLALGIGVNAAMFTLLDRLYLRAPDGVAEPSTLRRVWVEHFRTRGGVPFTSQSMHYGMSRVVRDAFGDAPQLALYNAMSSVRLSREAGAPTAWRVYATANFFPVLGLRPARGRFYTAEEDRLGAGAEVVVLSDAFWRRHFGGDPDIVGKTMTLGAQTFTIIGVTAPGFTGLELQPVDLWAPLGAMPSRGSEPWWEGTSTYSLRAVMRVQDVAAMGAFEQHATRLMREFNRRGSNAGDTLMNVYAGPIIEARGPGRVDEEVAISVRLGGVSAVVLLIACANVINLLLARAMQRRRENAVRLALGISRWRMMRLVGAETALLALLAGTAALFAAHVGGSLLRSLLLPDIEWTTRVLDGRVLAFTAAVTLCAALIAGIIPAIQSTRADLTHSLKAGARSGVRHRSRLRGGLVVVQAALSVVLLVGAALFVRSLRNVQNLDIGIDADRVIVGRLRFAVGETPPGAVLDAAMRELAERLAQSPGVEGAARATLEPMLGLSWLTYYTDADSINPVNATWTGVSAGYFGTIGLDILRGRGFGENARGHEVVVNEAMASAAWPGRDALGQCMHFEARDNPCYRVVGVVENSANDQIIEDERSAQYYLPIENMPDKGWEGSAILVRAEPRAAAVAAETLRTALKAAFPTSVPETTAVLEYLEPQYRPWRLGARLFTAFGLLALLVAIVGIYTTVSYGVTQRTHEFGVRMALGARIRHVLAQVIGEGLRTVAYGVLAGIALALAAGRLIAALLYGVEPHDPAALAIVAAILVGVGVVAALVPAWRAARVDPLTTLRAD